MKKIWKIFLAVLMLSLGVAGAGELPGMAADVQTEAEKGKASIELQYSEQKEFRLSDGEIREGDSAEAVLQGKGNGNVTWSSTKPGILSVDSQGNVTAKHTGTAVLVARYTCRNQVYRYTMEVKVVDRWTAEQRKFPSGSYWNNGEDNDKVTGTPCRHTGNGYEGCKSNCFRCEIAGTQITAYQCHGFALKVADDILGDLKKWKYCSSYKGVQAGDVVRINHSHTIIITKVFENSIQYADCNGDGDCQIQWGRTMTKETLRSVFNYMYTRK